VSFARAYWQSLEVKMALRLGLPSKGRMMDQCISWFADRNIHIARSGSDREYAGTVEGFDDIELMLLSSGEIPRQLAAGVIHLGITGADLIGEKLGPKKSQLDVLADLGFGRADLVIAVPNAWVDVSSLHDLDSVAADFRAHHGFRLRIATKYHRLTRDFLRAAGVADYQLVDSQGATEGTIKNETAEAISDITTTGSTLTANHLKVLNDGVILQSQAQLYSSQVASWDATQRATLERFLKHIA